MTEAQHFATRLLFLECFSSTLLISTTFMAAIPTSITMKNVLVVIFPGFNTLDMNGPYEILKMAGNGKIFTLTIASETEITTSSEGIQVKVSQLKSRRKIIAQD